MDIYLNERGVIRGKVCAECGGELLRRGRRSWCDWCCAYVSAEKEKAIPRVKLPDEDRQWLRENGF